MAGRYDPMDKVRKPVPPPGFKIDGIKYNKGKQRKNLNRIIDDGIEEYYDEYRDDCVNS